MASPTTKLNRTPLALIALVAAACNVSGSGFQSAPISPAPVTTPLRFLPPDASKIDTPAGTLVDDGCLSLLADPPSGIRLTLVRSENGVGDYAVPGGAYGVSNDQLLRLDCNTGAVLGVVRR